MWGFWGVDAISDRSFRLIAAGWIRSSEDRFGRAWRSFKSFLCASSIPLHHVSLRVVMDFLTHLYGMCMSWSTIATHGSTISMTMAPVDGVNVGDLLLIKRLMRGVFKERPSRRFIPAPWDPLRVFGIFQLWPAELPLSS
jgi:hypothetical protein